MPWCIVPADMPSRHTTALTNGRMILLIASSCSERFYSTQDLLKARSVNLGLRVLLPLSFPKPPPSAVRCKRSEFKRQCRPSSVPKTINGKILLEPRRWFVLTPLRKMLLEWVRPVLMAMVPSHACADLGGHCEFGKWLVPLNDFLSAAGGCLQRVTASEALSMQSFRPKVYTSKELYFW